MQSADRVPCLVMEYAPHGDVGQIWPFLCPAEVTLIFQQTFAALSFAHERGIVHRDVKSQNLLVFSRHPLVMQLADFGTSGYGPFQQYLGTPSNIAPEMVRSTHCNYTVKADVWAEGMMLREAAGGARRPPYSPAYDDQGSLIDHDKQNNRLWDRWLFEISTLSFRRSEFRIFQRALRQILQGDAAQRPSAEACLSLFRACHHGELKSFIHRDRGALTICLSALLEYGMLDRFKRNATLRSASSSAGSLERPFSACDRALEPGLYVGPEVALQVVREVLPLLEIPLKDCLSGLKDGV